MDFFGDTVLVNSGTVIISIFGFEVGSNNLSFELSFKSKEKFNVVF